MRRAERTFKVEWRGFTGRWHLCSDVFKTKRAAQAYAGKVRNNGTMARVVGDGDRRKAV